jgi:hypothetical protein
MTQASMGLASRSHRCDRRLIETATSMPATLGRGASSGGGLTDAWTCHFDRPGECCHKHPSGDPPVEDPCDH